MSWHGARAGGIAAALLLALGALGDSSARADSSIYKYRDANGNLIYSEQKPESAKT